MSTVGLNRLPGVNFELGASKPSETLPRMDIALLAGFAPRGPVGLPVAVEDANRFHDLFGGTARLVWDESSGGWAQSQLGPSVEQFFRNGGRRCYVQRLADAGTATTNEFHVPGLVTSDGGPAVVRARCPGSWSDNLLVSARLRRVFWTVTALDPGNRILELAASRATLVPGDLLQVQGADAAKSWLVVETVDAEAGFVRIHWSADGREGVSPGEISGLQSGAEQLTFDLLVWEETSLIARIDNLGFAPAHPRFWARLPGDEALFAPRLSCEAPTVWEDLWTEASQPRFPLAGPEWLDGGRGWERTFLPVEMPTSVGVEWATGPVNIDASLSELERDGLGAFETSLFLDDTLAWMGSESLMAEAEFKAQVLNQQVAGLHSALLLEEVTLLASPDAMHRGWRKAESVVAGSEPLNAPELNRVSPAGTGETLCIWWESVPNAVRYELQFALDADFLVQLKTYSTGDTQMEERVTEVCPQTRFFRVRARSGELFSPWSITRQVVVPYPEFVDCSARSLEASSLSWPEETSPSSGRFRLQWSEAAGADRYVLQVSADPDFDVAREFEQDAGTSSEAQPDRSQTWFYRVRPVANSRLGPWSNTVWILAAPIRWTAVSEDEYEPEGLLAVHQTMLRIGAARGDILVVLTFPRHFRGDEVAAHLQTLQKGIDLRRVDSGDADAPRVLPLMRPGEERVFGYGACFHPWVWTRTGSDTRTEPHAVSPDGAVCGLLAATALRRDAWIAPANVPMAGVLALEPEFDEADWAIFWEHQVNLIRPDPRGFLTLSAETLSNTPETQPISVRRLLMLLRRLAWREGMKILFAPNHTRFQSTVKRRFETVLGDLYARGAFGGATAAEGFEVVLPTALNDQQARDAGRLVVHLKVAPSQPLTFLTVRMVQEGGRLTIETEA